MKRMILPAMLVCISLAALGADKASPRTYWLYGFGKSCGDVTEDLKPPTNGEAFYRGMLSGYFTGRNLERSRGAFGGNVGNGVSVPTLLATLAKTCSDLPLLTLNEALNAVYEEVARQRGQK